MHSLMVLLGIKMRLSIFKGGKCYVIKYPPLPNDVSLEILTYQNNNYISKRFLRYSWPKWWPAKGLQIIYINRPPFRPDFTYKSVLYVQLHHGFSST